MHILILLAKYKFKTCIMFLSFLETIYICYIYVKGDTHTHTHMLRGKKVQFTFLAKSYQVHSKSIRFHIVQPSNSSQFLLYINPGHQLSKVFVWPIRENPHGNHLVFKSSKLCSLGNPSETESQLQSSNNSTEMWLNLVHSECFLRFLESM